MDGGRDVVMTAQHFFGNPNFREYVRLLHQLHRLIRADADETAQGEALRERMDGPSGSLDQHEIACINGISADFYTLSEPPWRVQPGVPGFREELQAAIEARDRGDYVRALDLVRKNQPYCDSATVSTLRGSIWLQAGETEIAADFFRMANEPDSPNGA